MWRGVCGRVGVWGCEVSVRCVVVGDVVGDVAIMVVGVVMVVVVEDTIFNDDNLQQKQKFEKLTIEVEGIREKGELPSLFQKIHSKIKFDGKIDKKKAFRACELSFTKYCSVSKTLEATADITFSVYINNKKVLT